MLRTFLEQLGVTIPVVQAPMAGTSTPGLAAAVSNAGGLGSIAVGAMKAPDAERIIADVRKLTDRSFNVNVFCHQPARADAVLEQAWLTKLEPLFKRYCAKPPHELREIYTSFLVDEEMIDTIVRAAPPVVSFHFGLPSAQVAAKLKSRGMILLATVTNLSEAEQAAEVGVDALVAQGYEAGGHRGVFDPDAPDDRLGVLSLVRLLVQRQQLPVIAAGGIMDGAGVAAVLALGAVAAQLGTAFIACPESAADEAHRRVLTGDGGRHTTMTRVISGRPARCVANEFTRWGTDVADADVPAYPIAYDAGKSINAAAKAAGEFGYGAQWAGQGASMSRSMPAAEMMMALSRELAAARLR